MVMSKRVGRPRGSKNIRTTAATKRRTTIAKRRGGAGTRKRRS